MGSTSESGPLGCRHHHDEKSKRQNAAVRGVVANYCACQRMHWNIVSLLIVASCASAWTPDFRKQTSARLSHLARGSSSHYKLTRAASTIPFRSRLSMTTNDNSKKKKEDDDWETDDDDISQQTFMAKEERDLFIPIFALVSLAGLFGTYAYEMIRLWSRGELYLPWT